MIQIYDPVIKMSVTIITQRKKNKKLTIDDPEIAFKPYLQT